MAPRILSLALLACLAGLAAAPAYADSVATYERQCSRDKWSGVYRCWADYNSPYSSSSTYCSGGHCDTTVRLKAQPKPPEPIVQDPRSSRIMDGHGPR
jgi:hypothetical protein